MEKPIQSELIGKFTYHEDLKTFNAINGEIHWTLDLGNELVDRSNLIKRAENLSLLFEEFDQKARRDIAEKLIDYKNDFWPEYDEEDENLDWAAVDAGKYDVTEDELAEAITLYEIVIRANEVYCEYHDGDLFGGHRIHAYFDNDYKLLSADV